MKRWLNLERWGYLLLEVSDWCHGYACT